MLFESYMSALGTDEVRYAVTNVSLCVCVCVCVCVCAEQCSNERKCVE